MGSVGGQAVQSHRVGWRLLGRGERGAEFGGDLFEGFLAFEMRHALHAPAAIQVPVD